jgi:hypothetical protein
VDRDATGFRAIDGHTPLLPLWQNESFVREVLEEEPRADAQMDALWKEI